MIHRLRNLALRLGSEPVRKTCAGQGWRLALNALLSSGAAVFESASLILLTALALEVTGTAPGEIGFLAGLSGKLSFLTLVLAMGAVIVARLILQALAALVAARTISTLVAERRRRAVGTYLQASWLAQAEADPGHLQDLTNNFSPRVGQLLGNLIQLINRGLSALIMLMVAVVVSPLAAGIVVTLSLAVFALLAPLRSRIRGLARRGSGLNFELGRRVAELAGLVREIRTYAVAERVLSDLDRPISALRATQIRGELGLGLSAPLFQAIALAGFTVVLGLAGLVFEGNVASLGAVVLVAFRSLSYGQAMLINVNRIIDQAPWAERFEHSVARFESSPVRFGRETLPARLVLSFDEVAFRYPTKEASALGGVTCRIEPGQAVGLVGPTGAGKSTFVGLVLRLIQPTGGRYEINGLPAWEYDARSWGDRFAFVPQAPQILAGTVRENVSFFRQVSDEAVERALRAANLWQEIEELPEGLDTPIGLLGSDLSGGQRQRLALARALAGEPGVLVLDEPTSALDPLSERAIVSSLETLRGSVTILTVAHRLTTLRACDLILVLEGGRLVDAGPPEEMAARPGFFSRSLAAGRFSVAKRDVS